MFTVGKFGIVDIFDTNKYANNPKNDFLNWALINAGTFDYAGDAWGFTYGAAAEWYQGRWTVRARDFRPLGDARGRRRSTGPPMASTQFEPVSGGRRNRGAPRIHGQPGKLKVTGFLSRGRMGNFQDAVNAANWLGMDASLALALTTNSATGQA